jgi:hypothetical protein
MPETLTDPVAAVAGADVARVDAVALVLDLAAAAAPLYADALRSIAAEYVYCAAFVDAAALDESSVARYLDRNADSYARASEDESRDRLARLVDLGRARGYQDARRVLALASEAAERAAVIHAGHEHRCGR